MDQHKKTVILCIFLIFTIYFSGSNSKKTLETNQTADATIHSDSKTETKEETDSNDKVDYKKLLPAENDWNIVKNATVNLNDNFTIVGAYCERDKKAMLGQFFVFSKDNKLLLKSTEFETSSVLDEDVYILKVRDKTLIFGEYIWGGARGMMYSGIAFTIDSNNVVKEVNSNVLLGLNGNATVTNNSIVLEGEVIKNKLELSIQDGIYKEELINDSNSSENSSEKAKSETLPSNKTKDDSLISFKLNVGDNKHSFIIFMEATPIPNNDNNFYDSNLKISICDVNNISSQHQIVEDYTYGTLFKDYKVEDVNFDGYLDLYYVDSRGNANIYYHFWLWNPKTEKFVDSTELNDVSLPSFDRKTNIVSGFNRSSAASNTQTYYKYINGVLTCIRILDMGYPDKNNYQLLTVQDYPDGKMVEVFSKKTILTNDFSGKTYDEFFKWQDLNYNGTN